MALRTCLRRAAHQLSSRSLLASAATQSRGLTAAVAGGDDITIVNGGEYFRHIWKSSEGQYAAQLASGRWAHIPIKITRDSIGGLVRIGAEVIEDTKPAGFDERINIPEDPEDYESLPEAAQAFIDAATTNTVRAKWCMDGATSIEQAAQMLEAHAAYVRGLSKNGWYADGPCHDDHFWLHRDLIAKEEGEKPAGFERIQDSSDATQVFVEEDPPDQLSTGEEGPAAADHCQRLQTPAGSNMPAVVWKSSEGQYAAELASGKWVRGSGAEVIEDTKPAGFDERINIPEDYEDYEDYEDPEDYESLPDAAQAFIDAATSNLVRAKWCMDGATSIEEAAQMLEAYAAYVRGLSKDGWYACDSCDDDYFNLCRYFK